VILAVDVIFPGVSSDKKIREDNKKKKSGLGGILAIDAKSRGLLKQKKKTTAKKKPSIVVRV